MPTLEIQGQEIEVDESFLSLSPEQQNATVDEISQSLGIQAQAEQPEPEKQNYAAGIIDSATNLFGLGQHITAAEDTLLGKTPEGDWFNYEDSMGDRYNKALEFERNQNNQFQDENPIASMGADVVGSGIALIPAGTTALGAKALGMAGSLGSRALGLGLSSGALSGMETVLDGGSTEDAAQSALVGGAMGGAIPIVGKMAKSTITPLAQRLLGGSQTISKLQKKAVKKIASTMDDAGLSVDDAADGIASGRVLAQQDDTLSDLARATHRQGGAARSNINEALEAGFEQNQTTAQSAIKDGLGGDSNFYSWLDTFKKSKVSKAKPLYEHAFKQNWGKNGPPFELDEVLPLVPAQALKQAQTIAKANGKPLFGDLVASIDDVADKVTFKRLPTLQEAEYIRRALDDLASNAYRSGSGGAGEALKGVSDKIRRITDKASPALKSVRQAYADDYSIHKAAEQAKTWITKDADFVEHSISAMSGPEKEAAARGFAAALKGQLEKGQLNRDQIRVVFGSKQKRRALQSLWKDEKSFTKFEQEMSKGAEFNAMRQTVAGNSKTSMDLNDKNHLEAGINAAADLGAGNYVGIVRRSLGWLGNKFNKTDPKQVEEMASILFESDPAKFKMLFQSASGGNKKAQDAIQNEMMKIIGGAGAVSGAVAVSQ